MELKPVEALLVPVVELEATVDEAGPAPAKVIKPAVIEGGEPPIEEPKPQPVTPGGGGAAGARLL